MDNLNTITVPKQDLGEWSTAFLKWKTEIENSYSVANGDFERWFKLTNKTTAEAINIYVYSLKYRTGNEIAIVGDGEHAGSSKNAKKFEDIVNLSDSKCFTFAVLCGNNSPSDVLASEEGNKLFDLMKEYLVSIESFGTYKTTSIKLTDLVRRAKEKPGNIIRGNVKGYNIALVPFDKICSYIELFDNRPYMNAYYNTNKYVKLVEDLDNDGAKKSKYSRNWMIAGAPGTGKSHMLDEKAVDLVFENTREKMIDDMAALDTSTHTDSEKRNAAIVEVDKKIAHHVRRVLFFDGYTYGDFIGCYKPKPTVDYTYFYDKKTSDVALLEVANAKAIYKKNGISYSYEPGAFMRIYVDALNNPNQNYVLIIEEINRAKAANVFGELFQLLDRNDDGTGKYKITPSIELEEFLVENCENYYGYLSLPSNLYIWATMNAADQGVKSLDAAFQRRWNPYWKNVYDAKKSRKICLYHSKKIFNVEWNEFRKFINSKIKLYGNISEDKLIGEWYFSNGELEAIKDHTIGVLNNKEDYSEVYNPLIYKLCTYLRQDVARMAPEQMFVKGALMSEIINLYDYNNGVVPDIDEIFEASVIEWNELFKDAETLDDL